MLLLHAQLRLGLRSTPPSDQLNGWMIPKMIPGPGKGGLVPCKYGHVWYLTVSFKGGVLPDSCQLILERVFIRGLQNASAISLEGGGPRGVGP